MPIQIKTLPTNPPADWDEQSSNPILKEHLKEIRRLHNILIAEHKRSILIILQGMDASGKDSTIKKVISAMNPNGLSIHTFKTPTKLELEHDFLWRVHPCVPKKGEVVVFNRSHYEDVLIQRVHQWVDEDTICNRFQHINQFEKLLSDHNTIILKFFLNISSEEQLRKLNDRLVNPKKKWKSDPHDFEERKFWDKYMLCYQDILNHCNEIPWYPIPSDNKSYKELLIAKTIHETLLHMNLSYPQSNPVVSP